MFIQKVSNISNCASGVSTTTSLFNNSSMNTISDYLNERPHTISAGMSLVLNIYFCLIKIMLLLIIVKYMQDTLF